MMKGGDLYELAKILGHANIKDDRTLCQAGPATYRKNRQLSAGSPKLMEQEEADVANMG